MHCILRYKTPPTFEGVEFPDECFGKNYHQYKSLLPPRCIPLAETIADAFAQTKK